MEVLQCSRIPGHSEATSTRSTVSNSKSVRTFGPRCQNTELVGFIWDERLSKSQGHIKAVVFQFQWWRTPEYPEETTGGISSQSAFSRGLLIRGVGSYYKLGAKWGGG